jgi:hypothetical protein
MSFSKEHTTYYLTDAGWIDVYSRVDFSGNIRQVNPVPLKYYMICTYREVQTSVYSEMQKSTEVEFEDNNEKEKIQELIKKHGTCPQCI